MKALRRTQRPPQSCQFGRSGEDNGGHTSQWRRSRDRDRRGVEGKGRLRTFHSDDDIDRILVLHLIDIDDDTRPLPVVLHDILVQLGLELFDQFERGIVRDREVR